MLHEAIVNMAGPTIPEYSCLTGQAHASQSIALQLSLEVAQLTMVHNPTGALATSPHLPWAIYVAQQSLIRQQRRSMSVAAWERCGSRVDGNRSNITPDSTEGAFAIPLGVSGLPGTAVFLTGSSDVDMWTEHPADAADAPILDALNTLQSAQLGLASYSSLARFFLDEIDTELEEGTFLLEERPVGLANFASSRL